MLGLVLPKELSFHSQEAGEEDDCAEGLFFCMALFLRFEEILASRGEPARSVKTTMVPGGVKA
jgi:hypothetical protein